MTETGVYLRTYLEPLSQWLNDPDVTDILVNRPGEVWFETIGAGMTAAEAPNVTALMLTRLAQQIAATSSQGVSREQPLLAATLPDGARVQIVAPPATRGPVALAIRKHVVSDLSLEDFEATGAFTGVKDAHTLNRRADVAAQRARIGSGEISGLLRDAVRSGRNIVISGGTATGKTTFLNALLKEVPDSDRVIAIEDTPEIHLPTRNCVGLVAVRNDLGEAQVGVEDLLRAALRMRPDRLLVGEIRGAEAFTFLRAINTGHAGSLTTVHADSADSAIEQIAMMTLEANLGMSKQDIVAYTRGVVDIVVQLSRSDGRRFVSEVSILD